MESDAELALSLVRRLGAREESVMSLLGLDPEILGRLLDKACALMDLGRLAQAEGLLIDLTDLAPDSQTLSRLLAECRRKRDGEEGAGR